MCLCQRLACISVLCLAFASPSQAATVRQYREQPRSWQHAYAFGVAEVLLMEGHICRSSDARRPLIEGVDERLASLTAINPRLWDESLLAAIIVILLELWPCPSPLQFK